MNEAAFVGMEIKSCWILVLSDVSRIDKGWPNAAPKVNRSALRYSPFFTLEAASRFLPPLGALTLANPSEPLC
jgi:hypothetical protein